MVKRIILVALKNFLVVVVLFLFFGSVPVKADSFTELQAQIDAKKSSITQLEQEAAQYNDELAKTQQTKKTLSSELNSIKSEVNVINLKIKATQTEIDQLSLEVEKLNLESKDTSNKILFSKDVIAQNLRNLYQQDRGDNDIATIFLKDVELSDVMSGIESMIYFDQSMEADLQTLKDLKVSLADQKSQSESVEKEMQVAKNTLDNRKTIATSIQSEKTDILAKTKNQEKNYQTLLQGIDKQRSDIEAEVYQLEEVLKAQIDPNLLPKAQSGILAWPVIGRVTQGFGATSDAQYFYNKGKYTNPTHNGIDIQSSIGTPVVAAGDGQIIAIGNQDKYCYRAAYGKFILIRHDNYLTTFYGHLSLQIVKVGDIVKRGDIIGYSGNTGFSTGPHLHFTVYFSPTVKITTSVSCGPMPIGAPVNPMDYL